MHDEDYGIGGLKGLPTADGNDLPSVTCTENDIGSRHIRHGYYHYPSQLKKTEYAVIDPHLVMGEKRIFVQKEFTRIERLPLRRAKKRRQTVIKYDASGDKEREERFFRRLADPKVPFDKLAESIPSRSLLDEICKRDISLLRCTWLIKVLYVNQMKRKASDKGRFGSRSSSEGAKQLKREWTKDVMEYADTLLRLVNKPDPRRAAKQWRDSAHISSSSGSSSVGVGISHPTLSRWTRFSRLLSWQMEEGLLSRSMVLKRVTDAMWLQGTSQRASPNALAFVLPLASMLLPELTLSSELSAKIWSSSSDQPHYNLPALAKDIMRYLSMAFGNVPFSVWENQQRRKDNDGVADATTLSSLMTSTPSLCESLQVPESSASIMRRVAKYKMLRLLDTSPHYSNNRPDIVRKICSQLQQVYTSSKKEYDACIHMLLEWTVSEKRKYLGFADKLAMALSILHTHTEYPFHADLRMAVSRIKKKKKKKMNNKASIISAAGATLLPAKDFTTIGFCFLENFLPSELDEIEKISALFREMTRILNSVRGTSRKEQGIVISVNNNNNDNNNKQQQQQQPNLKRKKLGGMATATNALMTKYGSSGSANRRKRKKHSAATSDRKEQQPLIISNIRYQRNSFLLGNFTGLEKAIVGVSWSMVLSCLPHPLGTLGGNPALSSPNPYWAAAAPRRPSRRYER
eukprot:jgi/Bigna1/81896/fgenesh1_pg.85_\